MELQRAEQCRETVCLRCPGSLWGAKSICRVHQRSIGEVESCPEWEGAGAGAMVKEERRAAAKTDDMEQVEEELKDYPWMQREIERLRELLAHVGAGLTSRYGLDASLPRGKGGHADGVHREAAVREKQRNRLQQLELKVTRIEQAGERLGDDRQRTVLEWLMEGRRMNEIARHLGISRTRLHEIKLDLTRELARHMFESGASGSSRPGKPDGGSRQASKRRQEG